MATRLVSIITVVGCTCEVHLHRVEPDEVGVADVTVHAVGLRSGRRRTSASAARALQLRLGALPAQPARPEVQLRLQVLLPCKPI